MSRVLILFVLLCGIISAVTEQTTFCENFDDWNDWSSSGWILSKQTKPIQVVPDHGSDYAYANKGTGSINPILTSLTLNDVTGTTHFSFKNYLSKKNDILYVYFKPSVSGATRILLRFISGEDISQWQYVYVTCTAYHTTNVFCCGESASDTCSGQIEIEAQLSYSTSIVAVDEFAVNGGTCATSTSVICGEFDEWNGWAHPYGWYLSTENESTIAEKNGGYVWANFVYPQPLLVSPTIARVTSATTYSFYYFASNALASDQIMVIFQKLDDLSYDTLDFTTIEASSEWKLVTGSCTSHKDTYCCGPDSADICDGTFQLQLQLGSTSVVAVDSFLINGDTCGQTTTEMYTSSESTLLSSTQSPATSRSPTPPSTLTSQTTSSLATNPSSQVNTIFTTINTKITTTHHGSSNAMLGPAVAIIILSLCASIIIAK